MKKTGTLIVLTAAAGVAAGIWTDRAVLRPTAHAPVAMKAAIHLAKTAADGPTNRSAPSLGM
jgi:hypothetical protein